MSSTEPKAPPPLQPSAPPPLEPDEDDKAPIYKNVEEILRDPLISGSDKDRVLKCLTRVIKHHEAFGEEPKFGNCDMKRNGQLMLYKIRRNRNVEHMPMDFMALSAFTSTFDR